MHNFSSFKSNGNDTLENVLESGHDGMNLLLDDDRDPVTYENVAKGCQIAMFVLAVIGTVTNVLSIVTLCSRSLRTQATSMGLIALAVADILVLVTCIFRYHVYYIFLDENQYLQAKFTRDAYFQVYIEPIYWMALGMSSLPVGES